MAVVEKPSSWRTPDPVLMAKFSRRRPTSSFSLKPAQREGGKGRKLISMTMITNVRPESDVHEPKPRRPLLPSFLPSPPSSSAQTRTFIGVIEKGDTAQELQPTHAHGIEVDEEVGEHQEMDHDDGGDEDPAHDVPREHADDQVDQGRRANQQDQKGLVDDKMLEPGPETDHAVRYGPEKDRGNDA